MRIRRSIAGLLAAGALASVVAAPVAAADPPSVADVLAADGQTFDNNWSDYDIVERAALTVLGAKPGSAVAALTDANASLTVFAPTDRAFRKLVHSLTGERYDTEKKTFNKLVKAVTGLVGQSKTIDTIEAVLLYHVVGANVPSSAVPGLDGQVVTTAGGGTFKVVVDTSVRLIDKDPDAANAHLILDRLDIPAGNSVIHTVNRVLRPINLP
ncbi:MAG TPA: fasciclin domain-containing protein [Candidatus Limnocylindrales bacterium]